MARLLIAEHQSAVLDLSELSKSGSRRLMTDFLETLYRVNREPLHLVIDEADLLAPQRLPRDMNRILGAMDDVVRRGRAHGLGVTLISQRPAVLNKDVLGQAEVLIALRMTNPRDVAAIDEWIRLHAEPGQAAELKASLPSLPIGTAWVWSPGWLERLDKVQIRQRRTFDSAATPRPGVPVRRPRLAPVDVERLRQHLESVQPVTGDGKPATKAASAEVAMWRRQVQQLQATVADLQARPVQVREVPALDEPSRAALTGAIEQIGTLVAGLAAISDQLAAVITATEAATPPAAKTSASEPDRRRAHAPVVRRSQPALAAAVEDQLRAGARRMLEVMGAHHPSRLTRAQLATLARMKSTSGTFSTYLSNLRRSGLLAEQDRLLEITDAGLATLGVDRIAPISAAQVRDQWRHAMRAGARRMLDVLIDRYPAGISRDDLALAVDLEATSGTFSTYLSNLRSNGLTTESAGQITADPILFQEPNAAS